MFFEKLLKSLKVGIIISGLLFCLLKISNVIIFIFKITFDYLGKLVLPDPIFLGFIIFGFITIVISIIYFISN